MFFMLQSSAQKNSKVRLKNAAANILLYLCFCQQIPWKNQKQQHFILFLKIINKHFSFSK